MGNGKTADFSSATYSAHARHALLLATNSCTRKVFFKRGNEPMHAVRWLASPRQGEKILLNDFWYFSSLKSTRKEKYLKIKDKSPSPVSSQNKKHLPYPLFLLHMQAQNKKLSKRKRRNRDFALCGARPTPPSARAAFPKRRAKTLLWRVKLQIVGEKQKIPKKRASSNI